MSVGEEGHRLHGEGEDVMVAFLVEPVHEMALQPVEGLPLGGGAVGETEVAEDALEVGLVEVADVPEDGLVTAVAGGHVHGVDDLLEAVVDDLAQGALLGVVLNDVVEVLEIIVTVVLADEIVEVHQELGGGYRAHELGRYGIDEVDELAAEALEVGGGDGYAAKLLEAADQERIHGDGHAVGETGSAAFVVLVEDVGIEVLEVLVCKMAAVEGLDLVDHDIAVLLDVVLLVELVAEGDDVLAGDVGIGVELGAGRSVCCCNIVLYEVAFLAEVEVCVELVDVGVGDFLVDGHQGVFHLPADLRACYAVIDVKVVDDRDDDCVFTVLTCTLVCLVYATGQFRLVVLFGCAIGFTYFHIMISFFRAIWVTKLAKQNLMGQPG